MQPKASFPAGIQNAFLFATFNALSFQIILSSPMVLFAKSLGANATVLGLIAGMMPMLVIFQIPAANYISRVGYKSFVYSGWGIRVLFIFAMAVVPLTGRFMNKASQLSLLIFLLFAFNLSRGISSCAWLPWITALVPAEIRGRYLAFDASVVNSGSCLAFLVAGFCLGNSPRPGQFAILILFSAIMGMISLHFLKRIPDAAPPDDAARRSREPIPWLAMAGYGPFKKLLWVNLGWAVAYGGLNTFTVAYLKSEAGLAEGTILYISSVMFLGGLFSLLIGTRLDRLGSKPIMTLSFVCWLAIVGGWISIAGRVVYGSLTLILTLQLLTGLGAALVNMANIRLAMAIVPEMGRSHFFALFSVVLNLTLGVAPVCWGLLIDFVAQVQFRWGGIEWNRFSIFFAGSAISFFATLCLCRRLEEPTASNVQRVLRELLIESPQRAWGRLWEKER